MKAQTVAFGLFTPKPGDIVVWKRGGGGHVDAIIRWDVESGEVIGGNVSDAVTKRQASLTNKFSTSRITHFTRVHQ